MRNEEVENQTVIRRYSTGKVGLAASWIIKLYLFLYLKKTSGIYLTGVDVQTRMRAGSADASIILSLVIEIPELDT